ncbi:hypothetical protein [Thermoanaerobacter sp. A7A]|uniref:hypothetical protein n=1 Tax=Thermoanaerobacter sp. A7A TaxID=1350366 RepID=UPI00041BA4AE|nr:hypothetical protein [Thermoanaerobacter sp. A7A]
MKKKIKVDSVEIIERGSKVTVHVWSTENEDFFEKKIDANSELIQKIKEIKEGDIIEIEYEEKEYMGKKLLKLKDIIK